MDELILMRSNVIGAYRRHENIVNAVFKFLISFFIAYKLSAISGDAIGSMQVVMVGIFFGAVSIVMSAGSYMVLLCLITVFYLAFASVEVAFLAFLALFLVLVFYVRIFPRESLLIPALVLGFYLKIPYAVVIFAGLYAGFSGIIPIAAGTFLYFAGRGINEVSALSPTAAFSPLAVMDTFSKIYVKLYELFASNFEWMAVAFVFAMTMIVMHAINSMSFDYAKETAPILGGIIMIVFLIVFQLLGKISLGIIGILLGGIVSILIAMIIRFFETVLDYSGAQRVEFEDNNFYYYVKMIPKVGSDRQTDEE